MKEQKLLHASVSTRHYSRPVHKNAYSTITAFHHDFYGLLQFLGVYLVHVVLSMHAYTTMYIWPLFVEQNQHKKLKPNEK